MKYSIYILGAAIILFGFGCNSKYGLGLNEKASLKDIGNLPENPLLLKVLTSSIYPADSTTTVLYGNNTAYSYAAHHNDAQYPGGAVLYEVTWQFQADEQWFGGNMPREIETIERIAFTNNNKPKYTRYNKDGQKMADPDNRPERINAIILKRMAVSP